MLIDQMTPDQLYPAQHGRGLDLSARPQGFGAYGDVASEFPAGLLIPRSEWQARIAERKERKATLAALCDQAGSKVKDQKSTNYCWANGPVRACEVLRVKSGLAPTVLSAASVAAQITRYRNVGGWGKDALDWIVSHGIVPDDKWPNAAISQSYATPANLELAKRYIVTGWWELEPGNLDQLISCLLWGFPVAVGYNWWGHEVCAVDPEWIDGEAAIAIDNSWGQGWGTNGRGVLQGRKMLPDDAVVPRVINAY